MAKKIQDWLETDVRPYREKPISWVSQFHFFRDPIRPTYSDLSYFFHPQTESFSISEKFIPTNALWKSRGGFIRCGTRCAIRTIARRAW